MDEFKDVPKFQIIGHSIGCLTAMLIEEEINKDGKLQNIVCLGSPLTKSPMQLNMAMDNVLSKIQKKHQEKRFNRDVKKFVFMAGNKDFMVSQKVTPSDIYKAYPDYMTADNSLVINIDTHMKHVFSSLNHASLFYSKYFQDSFVVFLTKVILGDNPVKLANEHLYQHHHVPVWVNATSEAFDFPGCESDYSGTVLEASVGSDLPLS